MIISKWEGWSRWLPRLCLNELGIHIHFSTLSPCWTFRTLVIMALCRGTGQECRACEWCASPSDSGSYYSLFYTRNHLGVNAQHWLPFVTPSRQRGKKRFWLPLPRVGLKCQMWKGNDQEPQTWGTTQTGYCSDVHYPLKTFHPACRWCETSKLEASQQERMGRKWNNSNYHN